MSPGFCISTDTGREFIHEVQKASTRRARVEETYLAAVRQHEDEWMHAVKLGPEALEQFKAAWEKRIGLLNNQYNSRNAQYEELIRLLHAEYDECVLAIHYEPILGDVKWWRPLNREYRVFKRLEPDEFVRVRETATARERRT